MTALERMKANPQVKKVQKVIQQSQTWKTEVEQREERILAMQNKGPGNQAVAAMIKEAAEDTKKALKGAKLATQRLAKATKNDPEKRDRLERLSERFGKSAELVDRGSKVFEFYEDVKAAQRAIEEVEGIEDLRAHPEESALAFDHLFGALGQLGTRLPRPANFYMEFLTHFNENGGFFTNVMRAPLADVRRKERAALSDERESAEPSVPPAAAVLTAPKTIEDVGKNIETISRLASSRYPKAKADLDQRLAKFQAAFSHLLEQIQQTKRPRYSLFNPKVSDFQIEQIIKAAEEVRSDISFLDMDVDIAQKGKRDRDRDLSTQPDSDFVKSLIEDWSRKKT